ncbi:AAA family ATPase, partial [Pelagibacterales bacterium SAG-MED07]|nr:AAA family ATPase [Pelagibacterales bacterium SAG-MED07]
MKILFFLGMMGSGKTTLGKIVSNKLNKRFVDIDKEIEFKEGMKISDLFQKKGESFFRKLEEKISLQNLKIT